MAVVICPGIHDPMLTESFLSQLFGDWRSRFQSGNLFVFPTQDYPAYSGIDIFNYLCSVTQSPAPFPPANGSFGQNDVKLPKLPIIFICFSAGVVGAIAAAWMWQQAGGQVKALIALDGWGVPLGGNFPIYRISHDRFTHWSSALLGGGVESFYADPPVEHLDLWSSPQTARGWWLHRTLTGVETASPATAKTVLSDWLTRHHE
ncbi:hypothetical protein [Lyngbya sp. PCC 8106]|uniref:hypothetical protein n=1 Tax=Lyngbya sp. (strain PCC 8106) TaxID=313612 RepID=UPI0000EAC6BD|nr:hypothetical protein [Lyngbya sp. PCC 8106]EAW34737.1 hypothetical protein L8106_25505 [Lyngbya sp. PCC 8106]